MPSRPPRRRRPPATWLAMLTLVACASAGARQITYVAPSRDTVTTEVEAAAGPAPTHLIFVQNRSTVPIVVTSVTLHRCENIHQQCDDPMRLKIEVGPGQRRQVARVTPGNEAFGFNFSYSFAWTTAPGAKGPSLSSTP